MRSLGAWYVECSKDSVAYRMQLVVTFHAPCNDQHFKRLVISPVRRDSPPEVFLNAWASA